MSENAAILIIEDEARIARVVKYKLDRRGFDTHLACDGADGLALARSVKPDMILLDWMLPDTNGLEVLTQLKNDSSTSDIPVIIMSARGMDTDRERAMQLGANNYIVKPFTSSVLQEAVEAALATG